jgi:hypothetical protein
MRNLGCTLALLLAGCSGEGTTTGSSDASAPTQGTGDGSPGTGSSSGSPNVDCTTQQIPPDPSGGCAPRLVTPQACEAVDLTGGRVYEIAWTTDGTGCETPWKLCVAGNPLSDSNSFCVDLSTNVNAGISRTGGIINVTASDLDGLTSDNGVYHALVASFYGSHHGSVAFRVTK